MTSPWYLTPLPLYGSGGRILRMFAATSPTCCLSMPATWNSVGRSTVKVMPVRRRHEHRVREAERELEVRALGRDPVAGAGDLQALAVALGHADDHVGDQRAGQAVQLLGPALVVGAGDVQLAVVAALDRDRLGDGVLTARPWGP